MKNKRFLTFMLALCLMAGCAVQRPSTASIVGNWQLVAILSDPGDGSGKWQPAAKNPAQEVTFSRTGNISGNLLSEATHYQITDSNHLAINLKGNTSAVTYRYHLKGDTLELNPPCREACGMRLVKKKL